VKATFQVDARPFNQQLRAYVKAVNIEQGKGLRKQGSLLAKDLIKATPPFDNRLSQGTFTQSFKAQRDAGNAAVAGDIRKLFRPALPAATLKQLPPVDQRRARRYVRNGEWDKLATLLHRMGGGKGSVTGRSVHTRATRELHNARRDTRGRVKKGAVVYVQNAPSINQLIRSRQKDVGTWKAGWMPAAQRLGVRGIPRWIAGKSGNGSIRDASTARLNPSITLINNVRGDAGRNINIAHAALQNRVRAMRTEIEKRLNHARRKAF
jgi:hypothetical protein